MWCVVHVSQWLEHLRRRWETWVQIPILPDSQQGPETRSPSSQLSALATGLEKCMLGWVSQSLLVHFVQNT